MEVKAQMQQVRQAFDDAQITFQSLNNEVLQKQEETAKLKTIVL
jgi:hypothetical protein